MTLRYTFNTHGIMKSHSRPTGQDQINQRTEKKSLRNKYREDCTNYSCFLIGTSTYISCI